MIQPAMPYIGESATLPLHVIESQPQIRMRNGFDQEGLRELAATIKQHGLLQPLVVRRTDANTYQLIAGERRLIACSMAGLAEVPVLIRVASDDEVPAIQAVENLQRVDLTLLDRAAGVAAIVGSIGARRTASMLGKSPAWVSKHLAVAKMPDDVRAVAAAGLCEDVEVLGMLKQIRARSKDAFAAATVAIEAGAASRESIRATLEKLKQPAAPRQQTFDDTAEPDTEDPREDAADPDDGAPVVTVRVTLGDHVLLLSALAVYHETDLTADGRRAVQQLANRLRAAAHVR